MLVESARQTGWQEFQFPLGIEMLFAARRPVETTKMTTQLTDSLGATWTYLPRHDQWETDDDMNHTECEGCHSSSTLDLDDFIEYIMEDRRADFEGDGHSLHLRLLGLRAD